MRKSMLIGCVLAGGLLAAVPGLQSKTQAQVVARRGGWVIVTPVDTANTSVTLVDRPVVDAVAATVSRELHEQSVTPFLAEVQVVNQTTLIDPLADYRFIGPGELDQNHWILRAQRQFLAAHTDTGAYLIVGHRSNPQTLHFTPSMIMVKPNSLQRPDNHTPAPIPNSPVETRTPKQVASAQ